MAVIGYYMEYLRLEFTIEDNITRATNYRLRYRASNQIGWSDYSDIVYILSATKPEKPPRPVRLSTDSTSITLKLQQTTDDGGSPITGYQLLVDEGDDFYSEFTAIDRYTTFTSPFTVTVADDSLIPEKVYRFIFKAVNVYGTSEGSLELIVGLGDQAPAPANLRVELLERQYDSFNVLWDVIAVSDLPIRGYVLLIDDGLQGDFEIAYDGSFNPQLT